MSSQQIHIFTYIVLFHHVRVHDEILYLFAYSITFSPTYQDHFISNYEDKLLDILKETHLEVQDILDILKEMIRKEKEEKEKEEAKQRQKEKSKGKGKVNVTADEPFEPARSYDET